MSRNHARRVHKFPCDGIARFQLKGGGDKEEVTYDQAYDDIFVITGCDKDEKGHRNFTREGMKRIMALNDRYTRIAHKFIIATMQAQAKAAHEKRLADAKKLTDEAPKPEATP